MIPYPDLFTCTRLRVTLAFALLAVFVSLPAAGQVRSFTAVAEIEGGRAGGRSRLAVELIVDRQTLPSEALRLAALVLDGGQGLLAASLQGRRDGRLRLGAVDYPVSLIVAKPTPRGERWVAVTERPLRLDQLPGEDEPDHPFGILDFLVDEHGRGEGIVYPAAAVGFDSEGYVVIEGTPRRSGRLLDVEPGH